jgi:TM2 domain-containing membrane protein YozV
MATPDNSVYYSSFGRRAAKLSFFLPGLGQIYNKQYFKGALVILISAFSVSLLLFLMLKPSRLSSSHLITLLWALPIIVWATCIYDAYISAIDQRRRDSRRYNVQITTTIRGLDVHNATFEEVTTTRNVSRLGACLILSRELIRGSQVSLEFEGNERVRARVVWAREVPDANEHLVGIELLTPLKQFD